MVLFQENHDQLARSFPLRSCETVFAGIVFQPETFFYRFGLNQMRFHFLFPKTVNIFVGNPVQSIATIGDNEPHISLPKMIGDLRNPDVSLLFQVQIALIVP